MANPITPVVDTDLENIKSQLEYAKALRGQSLDTKGENVSGFYVPKSPWLNFVQGLTGGGVESYQRGQQRDIEQSRNQQRQEFLAQMPSSTEAVPQAGPMEDGSSMPTVERTKSPLQQAKEMQQWGAKAMAIPGMEGLGGTVLTEAIKAPQRQAELLQKAQDRIYEIQAAASERRISKAEADERQAVLLKTLKQMGIDSAQLIASMRIGAAGSKPDMQLVDTVDADGNPVKQVVDMNAMKPGDTFNKPAKPQTKEQIAQGKLNEAPGRIDQIMTEAGDNEKAFGIIPAASNLLPDFVGSRVRDKVLTEDQQKARMKVQTQAAKVIHDVYGAALSRGEAFRANAWAPNPMDSYETTMTKLKAAKEYAAMMATESPAPKKPAAPAAPAGEEKWERRDGKLVRVN